MIRVLFVALVEAKSKVWGDSLYYYGQAQFVADGWGFVQPFPTISTGHSVPGADHPPGFVLLLAAFRKLGLTSPNSNRYALCVLGSITIVVVALLVKRLIGDRAGVIAAALVAVYPPLWINDGVLMSETLYVLSYAVALLCAYETWKKVSWKSVLGLSFALTVASLARPESVLLFVLIVVPVVLARTTVPWRKRAGYLVAAAAIPIMAFTPWILYNSNRFAEPVYISTGAGQTLLIANCAQTYSGEFIGYYGSQCLTEKYGAPLGVLDNSINDVNYRRAAFKFMSEHKRQLPKVILAREGRMWGVFRPLQQVHLDAQIEGRGNIPISWAAQYAYWVVASLGLVGMIIWRRRGLPLYPMMAQITITALVAALSFGITRYRAGAEVCFVILAATTIDAIIGLFRRSLNSATTPGPEEDPPTQAPSVASLPSS